jgi:hypothetical protein
MILLSQPLKCSCYWCLPPHLAISWCHLHPENTRLYPGWPILYAVFLACVRGRECGRRKLGKTNVLRRTAKNFSLERRMKTFQFLGYSL